jgi:hypothetical protein
MFDQQGHPILDDEAIDFADNESILIGVEAFFNEVKKPASSETADKIFGALFSGSFSLDSTIKRMSRSSYTANKKSFRTNF